MNISDIDLWMFFVRGDRDSFKQLFVKYYRSLCVVSEKYVNSSIVAEDIVQDVFYSLLKNRENLTLSHSPKAFLCRSVINASINYQKKYNKEQVSETLPELEDDINPDDILVTEEMYKVISDSISSLPEQCKKVFRLNRFEGLKHKEIAEKLDISIKTVKNHIGKALRIIRSDIESYNALSRK